MKIVVETLVAANPCDSVLIAGVDKVATLGVVKPVAVDLAERLALVGNLDSGNIVSTPG